MRAILIDPYKQTVTEKVLSGDTLQAYYDAIGCALIDFAGEPDPNHTAYGDDEALLTREPDDPMIQVGWYPERLSGRILIVGFDPSTGDSLPATISVDEIAEQVVFLVPATYTARTQEAE